MTVRIAQIAVVLTVIEVAVLVKWLGFTHTQAALMAFAFLFVGILVEEVIRFRAIKSRFPVGTELTLVALGVLVESLGWAAPLVFKLQILGTFAVLFAALVVEHAIIGIATTGAGLSGGWFIALRHAVGAVLDFSAVEAAGGTIWLVAPSVGTVGVLAATSVLEHVQGIRQGFGLR